MTLSLERPETVAVDAVAPDVVRVTMTRPDVRNAFDDVLIRDLTATFRALAERDDVRAIVLTGAGEAFSAGADLGYMRRAADRDEAENIEDAMAIAALMDSFWSLPQTTIARVNGHAFGGAVGLAACCDMAIASSGAIFALSETRLGIIPGAISPYVVEAIGARQARRWFQTGERFDAATARDIGLVHQVMDPGSLDEAVEAFLTELRKAGPMASRAAKALVAAVAGKDIDEDVRRESAERIARQRATDEGREGLSAFLEKRRPAWMT